MITNKVTKKVYVGKSTNLRARFYKYLNVKFLNVNRHSRVYKALLKFGPENFSLTILEFVEGKANVLKEREDFFIKVLKPQYNIVRSSFNLDLNKGGGRGPFSMKISLTIPLKVKHFLKNCLDPDLMEDHLLKFEFYERRGLYSFAGVSQRHFITANSSG